MTDPLLLAKKLKIVSSGVTSAAGLNLTDADWPSSGPNAPVAGDTIVAIVIGKMSACQVDTTHTWSSFRAPTPAAPTATGTTFSQSTDSLGFKTAAVFALAHDWVAGETLGFQAKNASTGLGQTTAVLYMLVRNAGDNPFSTLPALSYAGTSSSVFTHSARSNLRPGAPFVRLLMAQNSTSAAEEIDWASGASWSVATQLGGAIGGQYSSQLVTAAYFGLVPGDGVVQSEAATFSPVAYANATGLTFTLSSAAPANAGGANAPTIIGTIQGGQTLTSTDGIWEGDDTITYTRHWKHGTDPNDTASFVNIGSATATSYTLDETYVGQYLLLEVKAVNGAAPSGVFADSAVVGPVITGMLPSPSGTPLISGNSNTGLAITEEVLTADLSGVTWTLIGSTDRVVQWGHASQPTGTPVVLSTGPTRVVASTDVGQYLFVREYDRSGGAASDWSAPIKATRAYNAIIDLAYRLPTYDVLGNLVPGVDLLGASGFTPLYASAAAAGDYVDYSMVFLVNLHPDLAAPTTAVILSDTVDSETEVDFAPVNAAANVPISDFASTVSPAIIGSWVHPTDDDQLDMGTIPPNGGFVGLARRRTLTHGASEFQGDTFSWQANVTVVQF